MLQKLLPREGLENLLLSDDRPRTGLFSARSFKAEVEKG